MLQRLFSIINSGPEALNSLSDALPKYVASEIQLAKEALSYELQTLQTVVIKSVLSAVFLLFSLVAFTGAVVLGIQEYVKGFPASVAVLLISLLAAGAGVFCLYGIRNSGMKFGGTLKLLGRFSKGS